MKKLNIFALTGVMALTLVGCGSNNNVTTTSSTQQTQGETTTVVSESQSDTEVVEATDISKFDYYFMEDGTVAISNYRGDDAVVVVPSEIEGGTVTSVAGINMNNSIVKIVLPDTITVIGDGAFKSNYSLEEIVMSNNVQKIGDGAFERCRALTSLYLPDTLTELGEDGVSSNSVTEITIPKGLTELKKHGLAGTNLVTVTIPGNIKTVGERCFEDCRDLKEIIFEEGVEYIGTLAFNNAKSLERIEFPSTVTEINGCPYSSDCVIVAPAGSYAESWANRNGYTVEIKD